LNQHPHDELGQLRKEKLQRETNDVAGFVNARSREIEMDG
jgi:hypothetical protein